MAENENADAGVRRDARPDAPGRAAEPEAESFPLETWRDRARTVFGVSPHAIAGALFGQDADTFTEAEVRDLLERFAAREGV